MNYVLNAEILLIDDDDDDDDELVPVVLSKIRMKNQSASASSSSKQTTPSKSLVWAPSISVEGEKSRLDALLIANAKERGKLEAQLVALEKKRDQKLVLKEKQIKANRVAQEKASFECAICFEEKLRDSAMVPCGHTNCCHVCAIRVRDCPICGAKIKSILKIFF